MRIYSRRDRCADCDVPLVDAGILQAIISRNEDLVATWRGTDPAEQDQSRNRSKRRNSIYSAGFQKLLHFIPTEPAMEIGFRRRIRKKPGRLLIGWMTSDPDELTPEEAESLALPDSDDADGESMTISKRSCNGFRKIGTRTIRSLKFGTAKRRFADNLVACLREIGIASHKVPERPLAPGGSPRAGSQGQRNRPRGSGSHPAGVRSSTYFSLWGLTLQGRRSHKLKSLLRDATNPYTSSAS